MPDDFRKMLDIEEEAVSTDKELDALAEFIAKRQNSNSEPDPNNSKIPAGYTYLSQFVDHDISLDSQAKKLPWSTINLEHSFNERVPIFDLETLYGTDAVNDSKFLDQLLPLPLLELSKTSVQLDSKIQRPFLMDLPRRSNKKAKILDNRNDENLLVAQTHVAFATFHNTIVKVLHSENPGASRTELYREARRQTIRHYQYIVLKDLLPKIIDDGVLDDALKEGNKFYQPSQNDAYIPVEYSIAAFRTGHSMIRNLYNLNSVKDKQTLTDIRTFTGEAGADGFGLESIKTLPNDWMLDWNLFYNLTDWQTSPPNFNFAMKVTGEVSAMLGDMHGTANNGFQRMSSLPALDLFRGRLFKLPTGQAVVAKMNKSLPDLQKITALSSTEIEKYLIEDFNGINLKSVFSQKTPLLFYLLVEANEQRGGEKLGTAGSRIIAEVFVEMLKRSPHPILDKNTPTTLNFPSLTEPFHGGADKKFGMPEMLNFIGNKRINGNLINEGFLNPFAVTP